MKKIIIIDQNKNEYIYYKPADVAEIFIETMKVDGVYDSLDITIVELTEEQIDAQRYLSNTDWYTCRKVDSGTEIPQSVIDARADARSLL